MLMDWYEIQSLWYYLKFCSGPLACASDLLITKVGTEAGLFSKEGNKLLLFFGICFVSSSGFLHPASCPAVHTPEHHCLSSQGLCLCDGVSASLMSVWVIYTYNFSMYF